MARRARGGRVGEGDGPPLKIRAQDQEDLAVVAACLQDAVVLASDRGHMPKERRFVFVANRCKWEARPAPNEGGDPDPAEPYERVLCGVVFEEVTAVRYRGIDRRRRGRFLELLTIAIGEGSGEGKIIDLDFADGATVRLEAEALHCLVEDFGEPWPTRWRPRHR